MTRTAQLVTLVLRVVQRVLTRHLLRAAELNADKGPRGASTLIALVTFAQPVAAPAVVRKDVERRGM